MPARECAVGDKVSDKKKCGPGSPPWISCREVIADLLDYADGTLDEDRRRMLERHFKLCPPCREYLAQYLALPRLAAAALDASGPKVLDEAAAKRLEAFLREHACCAEDADASGSGHD